MQILVLDEHVEAFVVHIISLSLNLMPIHPAREAQIASLDIEEVLIPTLDEHVEAFVVHVTFISTMLIHLAREAQIALLVAKEVKIPAKFSDFLDVFSEERALILPEAIDLTQPRQRLLLAFKVTHWCSYLLCQKARRLSTPDIAISNIKWCRSDYPMYRRASRIISIRSRPRSLTSLSLFIRITSPSIPRIWARAMWRPQVSIS